MTTVDEPIALDGIGMVPMSAPVQPEPEPIDPKYLDLLRELGFTEIPTAAEVKQRLDERRTRTRDTVLTQADEGGWCFDGTRGVLANLRLPRTGERTNHVVRAQVSFTIEYNISAFTRASALARAQRTLLSEGALRRNLGGHRVSDVTATIQNEEGDTP